MPPQDLPIEPIVPQQSNYYVSAGPMAPTSGLQGALSGPWLLESQDLTVEYTRVPAGGFKSQILTLSGVSSTDFDFYSTRLNCIITANYSRKKSYDTYSNASYQQPQKFKAYALSADENDVPYGDLTTSTLGPAGTIVSYQPYLSRRLWNNAVDTEVVSGVTVANFVYYVSGATIPDSRPQTDPAAVMFQQNFIDPKRAGTPLNDNEAYAVMGPVWFQTAYMIQGTYSVKKESLSQYISFLDAIGQSLTQERLIKIPATPNGTGWWKADTGNVLYSKFRHDYN